MAPSCKLIVRGLLFVAVFAAGLGLTGLISDRADPQAAHAAATASPTATATAPACQAETGSGPNVFPWAAGASAAKFKGYCKCSCSFVKNCNTNADCGGGACIAAITCCTAAR